MFAFYPVQNEVGKGAFQECDQLAAVEGHVKWAGQAATAADIPRTIAQAFQVGVWLRGFGGLLALSEFLWRLDLAGRSCAAATQASGHCVGKPSRLGGVGRISSLAASLTLPSCPLALCTCRRQPLDARAPPMSTSQATF